MLGGHGGLPWHAGTFGLRGSVGTRHRFAAFRALQAAALPEQRCPPLPWRAGGEQPRHASTFGQRGMLARRHVWLTRQVGWARQFSAARRHVWLARHDGWAPRDPLWGISHVRVLHWCL